MNKLKKSLLIYFKGMGMGGADVVPGVSGGTIAFITGIYEKLLDSIKAVDFQALKLLFQLQFGAFWKKINGNFLLPLFLGIFTSLLSLTKVLLFLLANHPIPLWSFFFGLIIISAILVLRVVDQWNWKIVLAAVSGAAIAYFITEASPAATPDAPWFVFIAGAVAICAMILPGISGSFILLIFGKYEHIIRAVSELDLVTIAVFGAGCIVGLLSFVRVVSWLLKKYHNPTVAVLAGFMIGSLNKVWPWKLPVSFRINSHGERVPYITENVLPVEYNHQLDDPQVILAILFMALGIFLVVLIEKIANYKSKESYG